MLLPNFDSHKRFPHEGKASWNSHLGEKTLSKNDLIPNSTRGE